MLIGIIVSKGITKNDLRLGIARMVCFLIHYILGLSEQGCGWHVTIYMVRVYSCEDSLTYPDFLFNVPVLFLIVGLCLIIDLTYNLVYNVKDRKVMKGLGTMAGIGKYEFIIFDTCCYISWYRLFFWYFPYYFRYCSGYWYHSRNHTSGCTRTIPTVAVYNLY